MKSLRNSINAKCVECVHDPIGGAGGKLQQIAACTSYSCPLFDVRPKPKKDQRAPQRHLEGNIPFKGSHAIAPVEIVDSSLAKYPSRPENRVNLRKEA